MEKEKVFQILKELAKNKKPMNNLGMEDYGYLVNEHEIECFSHSSSTDELVIRVKEVLDKLGEDLINMGNDFERFVMVIEYNFQNELMMNEMEPIHEFIVKFVKDKKTSGIKAAQNTVSRLRSLQEINKRG